MSKDVVQAKALPAELRLAQAISEFEQGLSKDKKSEIRAQRTQTPQPEDVMQLTAMLNHDMSANGMTRGYGPRLTNFLQGVQAYVPLGDTLMNTQGMLGQSIWTIVRFSVLATTGVILQHSTYVDKLSKIFMKAGRSMPRHRDMATLFPKSKKLQDCLTEYFIVVVKLCHRIYQSSQSSRFQQLLDSYSNDFESFETQLNEHSRAIRDELFLQSVAMAKNEKEESSLFRLTSHRAREAKELKRREKERNRLLDRCSTYDHKPTWKRIRKEGNTESFKNDTSYQEWKSSKKACTQVFSGKLGSGKSVLLANIVDDLYINPDAKHQHIVFFFCHHSDKESLKARTVIGSIVRQVLEACTKTSSLLDVGANEASELESDQLIKILLRNSASISNTVYCIVDGLDDCSADERESILNNIITLQQNISILLCISTRWEPDKHSRLPITKLLSPTVSTIPENSPEIQAFINSEVDECIRSRRLVVQSDELIPVIKQVLTSGADGMFLWASLSIKSLCDLASDQDIIQALKTLPKNISGIYTRLLDKNISVHEHYQKAILQLIVIAYRPLNIQELREALSIEPGIMERNTMKLINDMTALLSCCGGLVILDEEELTVSLVHESALQFLLVPSASHSHGFTVAVAETRMAQIVTTYLNYVVFEGQISTNLVHTVNADSVIDNVLDLTSAQSSVLGSFARRFGKLEKGRNVDIAKVLAETAMSIRAKASPELALEKYAREYWFAHSIGILEIDPLTERLVEKLIKKGLPFSLPHLPADLTVWAVTNGYGKLLKILLDEGTAITDSKSFLGASVEATRNGSESVVRTILQHDSTAHFFQDEYEGLWYFVELWNVAAVHRHYAIIELLLKSNQCTYDLLHRTAYHFLHNFRFRTHEDVYLDEKLYELLVTSQVLDLNHACPEHRLHEPRYSASLEPQCKNLLHNAVLNGWEAQVELLLKQESIEIDGKNPMGGPTICITARLGKARIMAMLMKTGKVDINSKTNTGKTPLALAIEHGQWLIVRQILYLRGHGVQIDPNTKDSDGRTPLSWAAEQGATHSVKLLAETFDGELDLKQCCSNGRTPLSYAAQTGDPSMIGLLLSLMGGNWKAHEHTDNEGRTPIDYMEENDSLFSIASLLLVNSLEETAFKSTEKNLPQVETKVIGVDIWEMEG